MNGARIIPAETAEQIKQVRRLFREYAEGTGACECFQGFATEVAGLPGRYAAPTGRLFAVISEGYGSMPSHAAQIPAEDRWAIVAYVRALQRSRLATIDDVPADERSRIPNPPTVAAKTNAPSASTPPKQP